MKQSKIRKFFFCGALTVGLFALGCQGDRMTASSQDPASFEQPTATRIVRVDVPLEPSDPLVGYTVRRLLNTDRHIDDGNVQIAARDGVVELEGYVSTLSERDRAERLAERVRGVRSVDNALSLAHLDREDAAIWDDVHAALLLDPTAERAQLRLDVTDGTVGLDGTVESWPEKRLAIELARSVPGVRGIDDAIDVRYPEVRPDAEIETEIETRLDWDPFVRPVMVDVRVSRGIVELSGSVSSPEERERVFADAWTAGVNDVDVSRLSVLSSLDDPMLRNDPTRAPTA